MPELGVYRVARVAARRVAAELALAPPFDVERAALRFAQVLDEHIPASSDVIVLHAAAPGELPRIVVEQTLRETSAERRRFALAHGLGHVLLGWHPLGSPCDVATRPQELPVTVHDLVEGEANAFARELLLPRAWITSFDALDRPAELICHVAARAGVLTMPAARAVALLLPAGWVWAVTDSWGRVLDAGRSPGTSICAPAGGTELDPASFARHAVERHRDQHQGTDIWLWRFDAAATLQLPHDRTARVVAHDIARDLKLGEEGAAAIVARMEGVAGWANEQLGTASLAGMERVLADRSRATPGLLELAEHSEFAALMRAKATELVAKRLAR